MPTEGPARVTPNELCGTIERFITSNATSSDVENRWLCDQLQPVLTITRAVRSGSFSPEQQTAINAFRASEIEKELERKRHEIDVMERDLKKLKVA